MANLLLTEKCVRSCPYCFAKQYMDGTEDSSAITWENINYVADFLERSNLRQISLLGGEPLIHHQAAEIIEYLINRGFFVSVFTSGIMSNNMMESFVGKILSIKDVHSEKLTLVVNVNEPRFSPKSELDKVHNFLSSLSSFCSLSFNIYRLDYNIDFLADYILKFGIRRRVRIGIANPIPGSGNQYINPKDFKIAKNTLMDALARFYELDIWPMFDCGFPLCMFTDDDLGKLYKYTRNNLTFDCSPSIDIGPNLDCWSCFPLSNCKKSLKEFQNYAEMISYFYKIHDQVRREVSGIYLSCDTCKNRLKGICSGGCLAHIVNNFHQEGLLRNNYINELTL